jgi:hypothetical protein
MAVSDAPMTFTVRYMKNGRRFFVPAAAVPLDARAFIARWAREAGARLS